MIALGRNAAAGPLDFAPAALAAAIGKTARHLFDVTADFFDLEVAHKDAKAALGDLTSPILCLVVTADNGRRSLVCLDGLLINAIVELMTGASDKNVLRQPRPPTRIDAALAREFFAPFLARLPGEFRALTDTAALPEFDITGDEVDPTRLIYQLEDREYAVLSGQVTFQDGIRGGSLTLVLPTEIWAGDQAETAEADPVWAANLAQTILAAPLEMQAVLDTIPMTLGQVIGLKPGDMVPFPASALSDLRLRTRDGKDRLEARLGQINSKKAVSVTGFVRESGVATAPGITPADAKRVLAGELAKPEADGAGDMLAERSGVETVDADVAQPSS